MSKKGKKTSKDVMFSTDGKGHWWKREWVEQCSEKVFYYGQCQGVKGHKGVHWCYGAEGSFQWGDNKKDPQRAGAAGSIPPEHKSYISPLKMSKEYHLGHYTDSKVTDKKEIKRLENDKIKDGESITSPISEKECKKLGLDKRKIKKYKSKIRTANN